MVKIKKRKHNVILFYQNFKKKKGGGGLKKENSSNFPSQRSLAKKCKKSTIFQKQTVFFADRWKSYLNRKIAQKKILKNSEKSQNSNWLFPPKQVNWRKSSSFLVFIRSNWKISWKISPRISNCVQESGCFPDFVRQCWQQGFFPAVHPGSFMKVRTSGPAARTSPNPARHRIQVPAFRSLHPAA